MGGLICLMGKSSSGKDTIYKKLLEQSELSLGTLVIYTTRPIREGETDGVEYHFTDERGYEKLKSEGRIMEERCYQTVYGPWRYFTVSDEQFHPEKETYLMIGTLEAYRSLKAYLGEKVVLPIYIELDAGERLTRALARERQQAEPKYAEMCRRFLADEADFSEEKIIEAGIEKRFVNQDLSQCLDEITGYIREKLNGH